MQPSYAFSRRSWTSLQVLPGYAEAPDLESVPTKVSRISHLDSEQWRAEVDVPGWKSQPTCVSPEPWLLVVLDGLKNSPASLIDSRTREYRRCHARSFVRDAENNKSQHALSWSPFSQQRRWEISGHPCFRARYLPCPGKMVSPTQAKRGAGLSHGGRIAVLASRCTS
jgi:hypothetical protein